jgi:hypothetical protein
VAETAALKKVLVEVKPVEALAPVHSAQVITYQFNVPLLRHGIRRLVNPSMGDSGDAEEEGS